MPAEKAPPDTASGSLRAAAGRLAAWWRRRPERQRALLQAGGLFVLALAVWCVYYWRHRLVAISDPDAEDYAQIALQFFQGRGMTSRTMPLCGLEWLKLSGADPNGTGGVWPNLHRFPFMSWVEAALFHVFGTTDRALSVASGLFYVLNVPLVFLLGRRVFGPPTALLATFLYMLAPGALGQSITGLTEPATTFFLLSVLILLTGPRGRPALMLAGVLWGLSFWNRYTGAMLALPFSVYLWAQDRKRAPGNLAAFLLPMAAAMAPEMLRNLHQAHDPLFSLTATLMVPYRSLIAPTAHWWYVPVYVKPSDLLVAWPGPMLTKWWGELYGGWRYLPLQPGLVYLYPFLIVSLFLRAENHAQRRLRILLLALIAMHEITLPFLSNIVRYYAYLVPVMMLFAGWAIVTIARRVRPLLWPAPIFDPAHPGPRLAGSTVAAGIALAVLAAPMLVGWIRMDGPAPRLSARTAWVATSRRHTDAVKTAVREDEIVLCNAPWSVAWRADRRSVPLPSGPALVPFLAREYGLRIGAIFLLPRTLDSLETINWRQWEQVREGRRRVPGFHLARRFPDGAVLLLPGEGTPIEEPPDTAPPPERRRERNGLPGWR